jgi:hypothetical protein
MMQMRNCRHDNATSCFGRLLWYTSAEKQVVLLIISEGVLHDRDPPGFWVHRNIALPLYNHVMYGRQDGRNVTKREERRVCCDKAV